MLVRARTAHEVEPFAFQAAPAVMEALPAASLLHRGIIVFAHVIRSFDLAFLLRRAVP